MRVTEIHRHARVVRELRVITHLLAPVVGQGLAHGLCNAYELVSEGLHYLGSNGRIGVWQLDQHQQARRALDQRAYRAGIGLALDQVAFPVAGELPVIHFRSAHIGAQQVRHLAAPVLTA